VEIVRLQSVVLSASVTLTAFIVHDVARAEEVATASTPQRELKKISVTATRGPRDVEDIAGTVTVKTSDEITAEMSTDIKDLIRYEPGISVANSPARFGLAGFNIRGIEGNRVQIRIDGVRTSDAFSIGSFSDARRNLIDLDAVKTVEIIRGPASALYGSDAIGGVVSFVMKDPLDYIEAGKSHFVSGRSGYQSDDHGWFGGSTLALGNETFSGLLTYTHRDGEETENQGKVDSQDRTRTEPNPQAYDSDNVLTKFLWKPADDQTLRLTVNADRSNTQTNVLSNVGVSGTVNTQRQSGDDEQKRTRISLSHELLIATPLFDTFEWQAYWQKSETEQRTSEQRFTTTTGPISTVTRDRVFEFDQTLKGIDLLLRKDISAGSVDNLLTYGIETYWTDTEQLRTGIQRNLSTGATTSNIAPDNFPVRDFPNTRSRQLALYVQDEISFGGQWRLIPALRVDDYRLDPKPDAIFIADNPGVSTSRISETSVSPKLGVVWNFAENLSAYAQYAHGFRAPPYNDVNIGFTNLAFGYTAIANPDLKPEKSDGYEVGLHGSFGKSDWSLATYYTDYDDLIDSLVTVGVRNGLQVFQSQNLSSARIYGVELRGQFDLASAATGLQGWKLRSSIAYSRGDNRVTDQPLNSVDPLKGVLGIAYQPDVGNWGVELVGTAVEGKSRVDQTVSPQFQPGGYVTLDLLAHVNFGERAQVNVGVFNLTDKSYFDWSDVRGRLPTDTTIDRYTRPGINASISGTLRF
jgi:hemoglobin/transferrin/lactoferrin receptor protein